MKQQASHRDTLTASVIMAAVFLGGIINLHAASLGGLFKKKDSSDSKEPAEIVNPASVQVPVINAADEFKSRSDTAAAKVLAKGGKVAVVGFRVAFNTRGSAHASTDSKLANLGRTDSYELDSSLTMVVELEGITTEVMQQVANEAYQEFLAVLKKGGVDLVPPEQIKKTAGFAALDKEKSPYHRDHKMGDPREWQVVSPDELEFFILQGDRLIASAGNAFKLGTSRALNDISAELDATIVVPTIALDFAKMSSSGERKKGSVPGKRKRGQSQENEKGGSPRKTDFS